jgi:hypothetical protein
MRISMILGFLCFFSISYAQKVKVAWSEESKQELTYNSLVQGSGDEMVKLCFEEHGGGLFSKRKQTPILTRYNARLAEQGLKSFEVDEDDIVFNKLVSVKGNLFMFTSKYDRSSKSTSFFSQKIDGKTLNPSGKMQTLVSMSALARGKQSEADFELSKDSSKILMFGVSPYSTKQNEKYYMAVFDKDMKKLWDKTVELPYKDKYIDIFDYLVTNSGSVGVLLKHYDKEVKKEKIREDGANVPAYKTKFLVYGPQQASPKEYILNLGDKFVHDLELTSDNNNNLTMFGLYKNKYDGWVNGYFLSTISQSNDKIEVKKMEPFPEDLVTLIKKDKQGSTKEKDPGISAHFTLSQVVDREDGSTDYILEYYKMEIVTVQTRTGSYSYPIYYYGDIIDVNNNGSSTVFTRLPKWQETKSTSLYSGFKALTTKNKLILFYADDRDNVDRDLSKRPDDMVKFTKSVLAMAIIDQKGNLNRTMVYDHKEMKLTTCINVSCLLAKDKLGLYAQRGGGLFSSAKDMVGIISVE